MRANLSGRWILAGALLLGVGRLAPGLHTARAQGPAGTEHHATLQEAATRLAKLEQSRRDEIERWRAHLLRLQEAPVAGPGWQGDIDSFALALEISLDRDLRRIAAPSRVPAAQASPTSNPDPPAEKQRQALLAWEQILRSSRAEVSAMALRRLVRLEATRRAPPFAGGLFHAPTRARLIDRARQSLRLVDEHLRRRARRLRSLPERIADPATSHPLWGALAEGVITLVLFGLLLRRKDPILRGLRVALSRRITRPERRLGIERWLRLLTATLPPLTLLLFIETLGWALSPLGLGEVRLAVTLLAIWATYRVALQGALHLLTTWAAQTDAQSGPLTPRMRLRILRSLRLVGRTLVFVLAGLAGLDRLSGQGPLFSLFAALALLGLLSVALSLLSTWRTELLAAWRGSFAEGRLGRLASREHTHPALETAVAGLLGLFLLAIILARSLRDLALRFGRVRRLFAAFERRALERKGEVSEPDPESLAALPDALHDAFAEGPIDPGEALDHFPGLTEARRFFDTRADRGAGGSLALVGPPGSGRRSWLLALAEASTEVPTTTLTLPHRPHGDPAEAVTALCVMLIEGLKLACDPTPDAVVAALEARPLTRIVVKNPKLLALRCMDGLRPFEAFLEIVGRSAERVQWVCVFPDHLHRFLTRVYSQAHLFQHTVTLPPWDEEAIDALIESRMRRARVSPRYQISVVDHLDGTAFDAEVVHTARRYHRLVWDYSDGNPACALHFWLRSLSVDPRSGEIIVRLFRAPDRGELEALDERSRFVLACVALHDGITIADAARATGYGPGETEAVMESLRESDLLEERDRHLKIAVHWRRTVLRFLARNHLLAA